MPLKYNYHTHTKRCGHALDEDEDYVTGAIEAGFKALGFSDHVPLKGLAFPGMRQDYGMVEDYVNSITALKAKYRKDIELYIGYEAEYLPEFIGSYNELLSSRKIQYLICGQHCRIVEGKQVWYNQFRHDQSAVSAYVDDVIAAMHSGLYAYIAHPDHFMNGYRVWDDFAERESRRLIAEAARLKIPFEINVAGIRFAEYKHRKNGEGQPIENLYPYPAFWDIVSEMGASGIIGVDAHRRYDLLDGVENEAELFAGQHGVRLLEKLDIQ